MSTSSSDASQDASGSKGPQSVGRVFAIIEHLVANPEGATLSELAISADAPKTSLAGLLDAMVAEGCLRRDSARRYLLGARMLTLARRAIAGQELTKVAHPVLADLVHTTGETAVLGVLASDGKHVVYISKIESSNPVRYAVDLGMQRELYCTAIGKVLLSDFDKEQFNQFIAETKLRRFTPNTIGAAGTLRTEMAKVRHDGLARNNGERVRGASGIAAPIYSAEGRVIAALLIAGPSQRIDENRKANERALLGAAAAITQVMGGNRSGRARDSM